MWISIKISTSRKPTISSNFILTILFHNNIFCFSINNKIVEIFKKFDEAMGNFCNEPTDHDNTTSGTATGSGGPVATGPVTTGNTSTTNANKTTK